MKSIVLSIRPEWVCKILNGEKTIEIRKRFPKDYQGWIYIYCTKSNKYLLDLGNENDKSKYFIWNKKEHHYPFKYNFNEYTGKKMELNETFNGHIVARFYCNKVETFNVPYPAYFYEIKDKLSNITTNSCCDLQFLHLYLKDKTGYAIHISKLEIFNTPKVLSQKAPQSYCYLKNN